MTGADHGEPQHASGGQAAFLAEASRLLADSLDYETTTATVAGMALPHLGAWCFVDLLEPEGRMRRLAVIHPDPEMQALARRLESGWPPQRDDPFGLPHAVRTRRSEVISHVDEQMLRAAANGEENWRILQRLGIGSLMVVPLLARGQVLGAITYVSPRQRSPYTERDLQLAEDLAVRCAIAIDNARLYRAERRARAEAEQANRAKDQFLATMSHEIRTPINAVIGYVDLLETGVGGALSPDQVRYLERIKASNRHLLGLIDDVLDLARLEADQIRLHEEDAALGPVAETALDLVRPLAEGRSLALPEACEGEPGTRFVGDVDRVRQIAVNLLSNAIKFTGDGGRIRLLCGRAGRADPPGAPAPPERLQDAGASRSWTYLRVEDNGIGIAPDVLERLFQPFMQADTGYTRTREGSGLGLAISRRLARRMGGELTVQSEAEQGSSFTLWLPAPACAPRDEPGTAPAATLREPEPTRDQALRSEAQVRGVAAIGEWLLRGIGDLADAYVRQLREQHVAPGVEQMPHAVLQDHVAALIADLAQVLILLEHSPEDAADLLRDGSAIQRTIADRHGLQRQRLGWSADAVEREFDLLEAEVERAVGAAAPTDAEAAKHALRLLRGFLQQARRGSVRALARELGIVNYES